MANPEKTIVNFTSNRVQFQRIDLVIPRQCAGLRLDQALARLLPDFSRNRLQVWIREGRICLGGALGSAKNKVWGGETVTIEPRPLPAETINAPEAIPLDIVFEDGSLIIINKPPGLVVHPGSGNWQGTMLNALLNHAPQLGEIPRAGIVHRLDKGTSGLLVVAKTLKAQTSLARQLLQRTVKRDYLALVHGILNRDGKAEAPIGRHPVSRTKMAVVARGRPAVTYYRVLKHYPGCSLLQCSLETGRTHQIRVHMQAIGHPLVGDPVYRAGRAPQTARETLLRFPRQALHAARLGLTHPETGKTMSWQADMPEDMRSLLEALRQQD